MDKKEKKSQKILKQMSREKEKKEKKEKNKKTPKERVAAFFTVFKEYCIKDTTRMILLIAILIAAYIAINLGVRQINLAQIDLTQGKMHTLTDASKKLAKSVNKDITFYVWKFTEDSQVVDLMKQYHAENEKIKYQIVSSEDYTLKETYGMDEKNAEIVGVASDGRISYIFDTELTTYDSNWNLNDITEQKITNAINNLASEETTKVYFVEGRTNYTTTSGIYDLASELSNECYEINTINIISDPEIPEDCDILAIMGISSDFSEKEANAICEYIENGGDVIITNDINYTNADEKFPNFQKVLDEYGVTLPNAVVVEQSENTISGSQYDIQAEMSSSSEITAAMHKDPLKPLLRATGIVEVDTNKVAEQNVTYTPVLTTSNNAILYDFSTGKQVTKNSDESYYTTAASFNKMIESGEESRAVIFASTGSFSDNQLSTSSTAAIFYYQPNCNIIMNSFAFAANKGELYSIRKTSSTSIFSATDKEAKTVMMIIYAVPMTIIVAGICVWVSRRRLK